ncbi:MAG TPA: GxxExxY protein [Candidatus Methylomirabilis sp.]|nr:GxxExxY protein [Candidatus Methylomirabilis sp.]
MEGIVYKDLSYRINGLLFKVHKQLGYYRKEKQYGDYFEELLNALDIKYIREYRFKDEQFGEELARCVCDFIVDDKIIIEFKAKEFITKEDYFQVQRYLVTLNLRLAIIVNFRQHTLYPKRFLNKYFLENRS